MSDIEEIEDQIIACEARVDELWELRHKKAGVKSEDRLRIKIKKIHQIEDELYQQLADEIDDDFQEMKRRNFEGKIRYAYCDGVVHLELDKNDKFIMGYLCNC